MGVTEDSTGRWDRTTLPGNVAIGAGCYLERRGSFDRFRSRHDVGLRIGDGTTVYAWTEFNVEPDGAIEVGSDAVLVGAVFMCADRIVLGDRVHIGYHVTIADSDFHPRDPDARRADTIAVAPDVGSGRPAIATAPVVIEDDVQLGIGAIVLKGSRIGRGARIGAGCVITGDVPPGARLEGNPARPVAT